MQTNHRWICLLLCLTIFISGCVPTHQLEKLGIVAARGTDLLEDNQIDTTLNVIRFDPQQDSIYTTISGQGTTLKEARENAGNQTGFDLYEGQINIEIYGKETAQKGIGPYIGGLIRDARVSDTMKLAVSATTAKDIFEKNPDELEAVGQYLDNLFTIEIEEGNLPPSTLHDYTRRNMVNGQDPLLPVIGFRGEKPAILGLAIFQDDRYMTEVSLRDATLFNLFIHKLKNTPITLQLPIKPFQKNLDKQKYGTNDEKENFAASFIAVTGNTSTKVKSVENLKFQSDVKIDLNLVEISVPISFNEEKVVKLLEKEVEKKLKSDFETLLKKVKEVDADPFGFGKIYRSHRKVAVITDEEWRKKLPDIDVDFNVDVKIKHTGTIK